MAKIFISVGHGGSDSGCIAVDGSYEKDMNLSIALLLSEELKRHGHNVLMSRTVDEADKTSSEVSECNAFKPDYAVSIHCNASGSHTARGFEIYHTNDTTDKGVVLAKNINEAIIEAGYKSRGCKVKLNEQGEDYFYWIRKTTVPAVLCELAFIDNEEDFALLETNEGKKKMVITLLKGILKTLNQSYIEEVKEEVKTEEKENTESEVSVSQDIEELINEYLGVTKKILMRLLIK